MRIETYNPANMSLISSDATGVDFGEVIRGKHNDVAVVVKPVTSFETSFESLGLFLESSWEASHTMFGKFKSSDFITGITPGSDYLSDYFIPITGISDASMIGFYLDYGIALNPASPEFVWIDAEAGTYETLGSDTVNFRFIFEYN